ncbi:MAG TPA: DUF2127 domain-containing protein [Blastocatellia bacterium]|nr:DUF2127 domain-containing protein [Blastocatellia bacterium]
MTRKNNHSTGLKLIAIFKLVKGVLLLVVGIGALALIHRDVAQLAMNLVSSLHVDADNRHLHGLLVKLGLINSRRLEELSIGTFFYSALLLTEGIGLLLRKRWAEYLTVIATASFIPLEVYELIRRISFARIVVFGINIAIVWYLVVRLRRERQHELSGSVHQPAAIE